MVYLIDIINVIQILIKSMKLTIWVSPKQRFLMKFQIIEDLFKQNIRGGSKLTHNLK